MRAEIRMAYDADERIAALDANALAKVRAILPNAEIPEHPLPDKWRMGWDKSVHIIDLATQGRDLAQCGVSFTVARYLDQYIQDGPGVHQHTHLHIEAPHAFLLSVDEVEIITGDDEHRIARMFDEGWRILWTGDCAREGEIRHLSVLMGRQSGDSKCSRCPLRFMDGKS